MANKAGSSISAVIGGVLGTLGGGAEVVSLMKQLQALEEASLVAAHVTAENTKAVQASASQASSSGSVVGAVGRTVESVLAQGLGLSPLITGLIGLFGGGSDASTPAPLVKFALPAALNVSAGVSDSAPGQTFAVDAGQGGLLRPVVTGTAGAAGLPTQITVQVQAMDSQTFLDHSNDIALAVRKAMLESGVLNDVIREV
jgi:hypothetical protein